MQKSRTVLVLVAIVFVSRELAADSWDPDDNTYNGTRNELVHGSDQLHNLPYWGGLAGEDNDWYRFSQKPYSSYEVVIDTTSSAIGPTLTFDLVGSDHTTVLQSSLAVSGLTYSRSLRFYNDTGSAIDNQYIHVKSGACTTTCTSNDVYRIRFFDTTLALVKFDNEEPQYEYIYLQNPTNYSIDLRVYFWPKTGGSTPLCKTGMLTLAKKVMAVMDDDHIIMGGCTPGDDCDDICDTGGGLADLAGHATILNTGRYGDLGAKGNTVNFLFPSDVHFEFDTEMPPRPY